MNHAAETEMRQLYLVGKLVNNIKQIRIMREQIKIRENDKSLMEIVFYEDELKNFKKEYYLLINELQNEPI
jgi:hypothetical protein